jgi:hypothetical protein
MNPPLKFDFTFPRNYQVKLLEAAPPVHPLERLYHYPVELEEGDRTGAFLRVTPREKMAWTGFFALGFESDQVVNVVCSCPDPDSLCVVTGGYAYVVKATEPTQWLRIDQLPVMELRALPEQRLLLFAGFTSISALGDEGLKWTTERLSWEGVAITEIKGTILQGLGWDAFTDQEVRFEVDLLTGKHTGGARPGVAPAASE